jgi:hypothetical protein
MLWRSARVLSDVRTNMQNPQRALSKIAAKAIDEPSLVSNRHTLAIKKGQ